MRVLILLVALTAVASASAFDLYPLIKPQFASGDIISGQEAQPGEASYIVSLKTSSHFCAGSIIGAQLVITAAHCLTAYNSFTVVAGLHKRNDESQVQTRSVQRATQTIIHENYSGGVGPYDIGLIRVLIPFDLTQLNRETGLPAVSIVQLPSRQFSQVGDGTLFGWGRDNSNNLPNTLQKLYTEIIDYNTCKPRLPSNAPIHPLNVCSYNIGIASACNGDSGGPLIKDNGNVIELIGIVSWGYTPCTTTTYPSVYTAVDPYQDWISENEKVLALI